MDAFMIFIVRLWVKVLTPQSIPFIPYSLFENKGLIGDTNGLAFLLKTDTLRIGLR
jgi:hypothetical protein